MKEVDHGRVTSRDTLLPSEALGLPRPLLDDFTRFSSHLVALGLALDRRRLGILALHECRRAVHDLNEVEYDEHCDGGPDNGPLQRVRGLDARDCREPRALEEKVGLGRRRREELAVEVLEVSRALGHHDGNRICHQRRAELQAGFRGPGRVPDVVVHHRLCGWGKARPRGKHWGRKAGVVESRTHRPSPPRPPRRFSSSRRMH